MYFLKKLLSRLLFPVPLVLELMLAGWILRRYSRFKRTGLALLWAGPVLLALMGYGFFGSGYLHRLERTYPALGMERAGSPAYPPAGTDIVVLGQGMSDEAGVPMLSRVNPTMLVRLLEGVRVHRQIEDSRIMVSIGGRNPREDEERFVRELAGVTGLLPEDFVLMSGARDTAEEARNAKALVRGTRIVLVSSASHLPRAVRLFRRQGLDPIPAPCDFGTLSSNASDWTPADLLPGVGGLEAMERATYEFLGRLWTGAGGK